MTMHGDGSNGYSQLSSDAAKNFYETRLVQDPLFQGYYNYYSDQGFVFIPERALLFFGVRWPPVPGIAKVGEPYLLYIMPSFKPFDHSKQATHRAVSLSIVRANNTNSVSAAVAHISHDPFQITSLEYQLLVPSDSRTCESDVAAAAHPILSREMSRMVLETQPAEKLPVFFSPRLGAPSSSEMQERAAKLEGVWGPSAEEAGTIASTALRQLLEDEYARPLYPPGAIHSLLADTPLIEKWTSALVSATGNLGLGSGLGFSLCTCTCCCCNGSCSCSTVP